MKMSCLNQREINSAVAFVTARIVVHKYMASADPQTTHWHLSERPVKAPEIHVDICSTLDSSRFWKERQMNGIEER